MFPPFAVFTFRELFPFDAGPHLQGRGEQITDDRDLFPEKYSLSRTLSGFIKNIGQGQNVPSLRLL